MKYALGIRAKTEKYQTLLVNPKISEVILRGRTLGEEDAESRGGVWGKEWVKSGVNSCPESLDWLR